MSADRILQKYVERKVDSLGDAAEGQAVEVEETEDFKAFGWLRGIRDYARMLELRKRDGNIRAISYGWLEGVEFDPSEGITLHVGPERIRIIGRNLNAEIRPSVRLFEGITRHRVSWVQEADHSAGMMETGAAVVIERIE